MSARIWTGVVAVEKRLTEDRRYIERITWDSPAPPLDVVVFSGDAHEPAVIAARIVEVRREGPYVVADLAFSDNEAGRTQERAADAAIHHGGPPVWLAADLRIDEEHIVASDGDGLWMDQAALLGATIVDRMPAWPQCRIVAERTS